MTDVVLVQTSAEGQHIAWQIWRDTTKTQMEGRFTQELLDAMVEVSSDTVNEGYVYDGQGFTAPNNSP